MGSIIYTLVSSPRDSTRITNLGWISDLQIFDLINFFDFFLSFKSSTWSFDLSFCHDISQGVLMNKPNNSDGSRGQLTARTYTCHLLQIQSPWTWIWETGQTHSFAAFRTYKKWIPVVLRVPSASTRIFFMSYTRISPSRAHPCAYTGPHRMDPRVLPSWYISTTVFEFHHDDATRESYVATLFDCSKVSNIRVIPP
jgi:hypothetical protein